MDKLKAEYQRKEMRRKRWEEYRKLHAKNSAKMTNYEEWELWEDDMDWDEYMDDNYVPEAAKGMAADMKKRADKRAAEMKAAVKDKFAWVHLSCTWVDTN